MRGRRYGDAVGGAVEIHRLEEGGQFGGHAFGAGGTGGFGCAGGGDEIGPYSGRVSFLGQMGQLLRLRSEGGPVFSDRVSCRGGLSSSDGSRLSILLDVFELLVNEAGSSDEEGVGDGGGEVERGGGEVEGGVVDGDLAGEVDELVGEVFGGGVDVANDGGFVFEVVDFAEFGYVAPFVFPD